MWYQDKKTFEQEQRNNLSVKYTEALASCHSITYVDDKLIGDPLDVRMFEATNWYLEEPNTSSKYDDIVLAYVRPEKEKQIFDEEDISEKHYELAITRRFDFTSKL
jgi:magnesium-transporting ATPase (P-type)